jgi:hypothetical protein
MSPYCTPYLESFSRIPNLDSCIAAAAAIHLGKGDGDIGHEGVSHMPENWHDSIGFSEAGALLPQTHVHQQLGGIELCRVSVVEGLCHDIQCTLK